MDLASLKTTLSDVYGLDESSLPDGTDLDAIINQAVKKISIYYPELEITSLQSVVNQTRYVVTHTGLMKVNEVFYNPDNISTTFNNEIPTQGCGIAPQGTYSPSMATAQIYEKETMRRLYPYGADIVSFNKFDLIPTPTSVDTVYYEYHRYRTIDEIPDIFEEDLIELVYFFMEENTYKRSKIENGGNIFAFDRRGTITDDTAGSAESKHKIRQETIVNTVKEIKLKVLRLV